MNNSENKVSFKQFVLDKTGFNIEDRGIKVSKQGNALQLTGPEAEIKELNSHIGRNDEIKDYLGKRGIDNIRLRSTKTVETTQTLSDILSQNVDLKSVKFADTAQGISISFANPNDLQNVVDYMENNKDQLTMYSNVDDLISNMKQSIEINKPEYDKKQSQIKEQQKIAKMTVKEKLEATNFSFKEHDIEFNESGNGFIPKDSKSFKALIDHMVSKQKHPMIVDFVKYLGGWNNKLSEMIKNEEKIKVKQKIDAMSLEERLEATGFFPKDNGIEFKEDGNGFIPKDSKSFKALIDHMNSKQEDPRIADFVKYLGGWNNKLSEMIKNEEKIKVKQKIDAMSLEERLEATGFFPKDNGIEFKENGNEFIPKDSKSFKALIDHMNSKQEDPRIADFVGYLGGWTNDLSDMIKSEKRYEEEAEAQKKEIEEKNKEIDKHNAEVEEQQKIDAMTVEERLKETNFYPEEHGIEFEKDGMTFSYSSANSLKDLIKHIENNKKNPMIADLVRNLDNLKINLSEKIKSEMEQKRIDEHNAQVQEERQIAEMPLKDKLEQSGFDLEEHGIKVTSENSLKVTKPNGLKELIKHVERYKNHEMLKVSVYPQLVQWKTIFMQNHGNETSLQDRIEMTAFPLSDNKVTIDNNGQIDFDTDDSDLGVRIFTGLKEHLTKYIDKGDPLLPNDQGMKTLMSNVDSKIAMYTKLRKAEKEIEDIPMKDKLEQIGFSAEQQEEHGIITKGNQMLPTTFKGTKALIKHLNTTQATEENKVILDYLINKKLEGLEYYFGEMQAIQTKPMEERFAETGFTFSDHGISTSRSEEGKTNLSFDTIDGLSALIDHVEKNKDAFYIADFAEDLDTWKEQLQGAIEAEKAQEQDNLIDKGELEVDKLDYLSQAIQEGANITSQVSSTEEFGTNEDIQAPTVSMPASQGNDGLTTSSGL